MHLANIVPDMRHVKTADTRERSRINTRCGTRCYDLSPPRLWQNPQRPGSPTCAHACSTDCIPGERQRALRPNSVASSPLPRPTAGGALHAKVSVALITLPHDDLFAFAFGTGLSSRALAVGARRLTAPEADGTTLVLDLPRALALPASQLGLRLPGAPALLALPSSSLFAVGASLPFALCAGFLAAAPALLTHSGHTDAASPARVAERKPGEDAASLALSLHPSRALASRTGESPRSHALGTHGLAEGHGRP